ncbi:MAG: hypothetical protein ACQEUZ_17555 [Pseudomonadota bacterium]
MKRTILIAGAATVVAGLAGVALAHGLQDQRGGWSMMGGGMHGMMSDHHDGRMGGGMMRGGHGMRMMERADADGDGRVTREEAADFRAEQMESFDADGDGSLSLEEFGAMHAAHARPMMVDRFQAFDDDGDGQVTESEMAAPFERMMRFMDRDGDGAIGPSDMRRRHDDEGRMGPGMRRDAD